LFLILIAITTWFILSLLLNKRKREIPFGKLVSHKTWHIEDKNYIAEEVKFRNSVECIKYYNQLVFQLSEKVKSYELDAWASNKIETNNGFVQLFRYGNKIKLIRIRINYLHTRRNTYLAVLAYFFQEVKNSCFLCQ